MSEAATQPERTRPRWPARLLLLALALGIYGHSLANGFVYDDLLHIVDEPVPENFEQVARIFAEPMSPLVPYYRPIPRLLNVAQLWLHGPLPWAFHLVNLALAIGCALALGGLLRALLARRDDFATVTFTPLVFLAHPIAAECVYAAASGRETLLPTLFAWLACAAYLRATQRSRSFAIAAFALSLLSKEQAIAVPLLLACADALGIASDAPRGVRGWTARYAPYAATIAAYVIVRGVVIPESGSPGLAVLTAPDGPLLSFLYHLQTTFTPFRDVVYEPPLAVWWSPARVGIAACVAALLGLCAALRDWRRALWLIALIVLSLAPTANVLAQETQFAERWGLAALTGWAGLLDLAAAPARDLPLSSPLRVVPSARENLQMGVNGLRLLLSLLLQVLALAIFAWLSFGRAGAYRDNDTFLTQWLATNPASRQALVSSGEAHERRGDFATAEAAYRRVLALGPDEPLAHASLAIALANQGRATEAERHAERAVALDPADAETWTNLGALRMQRGDLRGAIAAHERALSLRPNLASAHNNLALALRRTRDPAGAIAHFERALEVNPQFAEAHANLGDLLASEGDTERARLHLTRALELAPDLTPARAALERLDRQSKR